jgi:hypothetical protein
MPNAELAALTRRENQSRDLPTSIAATPPEPLENVTTTHKRPMNIHVRKLWELVEMVDSGDAEVGMMYCVARFAGRYTAADTIRRMERVRETWPELVDGLEWVLRVRYGNAGDETAGGSELWAGLQNTAGGGGE